ncbi:MAG: hypothetical protein NTU49_05695, partial [Gammaproteobacteria bacterium]|nr:hypothetical protein [Gammaproteobacteria bacterium]
RAYRLEMPSNMSSAVFDAKFRIIIVLYIDIRYSSRVYSQSLYPAEMKMGAQKSHLHFRWV